VGGKRNHLTNFWTQCPEVADIPDGVYDIAMKQETEEHMEKKAYITEEEQKKCRKVADAFAELEDVDIVVIDAGRYGFVKLQYYTPPTGFENDFTFTDSRRLFDDLWEEWLHTQVIRLAGEMKIDDIDYDAVFGKLPEEKQNELMGRKQIFAETAGIEI
jgi:hypothetical protein